MGHEAGRHFWAHLGRFAKLAYMRAKRESEKMVESAESPRSEKEFGVGAQGIDARVRAGMGMGRNP